MSPLIIILALLVAACGSSLSNVAANVAETACGKVDDTKHGLVLAEALLVNVSGPNSDAVDVLIGVAKSRGLSRVEAACAAYSALDQLGKIRDQAESAIDRDAAERAIEQARELIGELTDASP